jgi:hypothetical protein
MKLIALEFHDDPILGNLKLDFTKNGVACDNILFAGDNGTGKTTILSRLYEFFSRGYVTRLFSAEFLADDGAQYMMRPNEETKLRGSFDVFDTSKILKERITRNRSYSGQGDTDTDPIDPRRNGCVISKARSDFRIEKIEGSRSTSIDTAKFQDDQNENFTFLKQLIIDLYAQDLEDYANTNVTGAKLIPSDQYLATKGRMSRFLSAINGFFSNLRMIGVETIDGEKKVQFLKWGKTISLDDLSTGEKQIVFRGTLLLQNMKKLAGGLALIDEPEISMHPSWQEKILKYYEDLFTNNGAQTTQIFFATHSEKVLEKALSDPLQKTIVIVLKNQNGAISATKIDTPLVLPYPSAPETNYWAFDMPSIEFHTELYNRVGEKYSKDKISEIDDCIFTSAPYLASPLPKTTMHKGTTYKTLPTYIRNEIDHKYPFTFTEAELRKSIELLIQIVR